MPFDEYISIACMFTLLLDSGKSFILYVSIKLCCSKNMLQYFVESKYISLKVSQQNENTINIADTTLCYKLARINLAFSFEEESCYWNILQQASEVRTCTSSCYIENNVSVEVIVNPKTKNFVFDIQLVCMIQKKQ